MMLCREHEESDSPTIYEDLTAIARVVDVLSSEVPAILIRTRLRHAEQGEVWVRVHGPNSQWKAWRVSDATCHVSLQSVLQSLVDSSTATEPQSGYNSRGP